MIKQINGFKLIVKHPLCDSGCGLDGKESI